MQCEPVGSFTKCGDFLIVNVIQECREIPLQGCVDASGTYYCGDFGTAKRVGNRYRVYSKRVLPGCEVRVVMAKYMRPCCLPEEAVVPDDDRGLAGTARIGRVTLRVFHARCVVMAFAKSLEDLARAEAWLREKCTIEKTEG